MGRSNVQQFVPVKKVGTSITPKVAGDSLDAIPIGSVTPAAGAFTTGEFSDEVEIANDKWHKGTDYAGTGVVNIAKVNVDDEIDIGGTLIVGPIEAEEDSGQITIFDMPVSATPAALAEMSITFKIDGDNVITIGAFADSAGGVSGHFVKNAGAVIANKTDGGAADYAPSILTSDYIVTVDTTAAARAVTISTEDRDTGSASNPRMFIVKDIAGNAGTNNITITLETAGTIDGAANVVLAANYDSVTIMIDGTNGFVV